MKRSLTLALTMVTAAAFADEKPTQQITKLQDLVAQIAPAENFSGNAQFTRLPQIASTVAVAPASVTFAPGAMTHWHIHPEGQYLIVIEGEGRTQEWGLPIQTIQKGEVVWCPPGVKHWHGASTQSAMTHIAISPVPTDGKKVIWLEKVELPQEKVLTKKSIEPVRLTTKQLSLVSIAAHTATGDLDKLKPALEHGLAEGLSTNEIKEALVHQYAYAGFPRALNGLLTFKSLLEERAQKGIQDLAGASPQDLPDATNFYQLGTQTLAQLTQRSPEEASKPLVDNFSPTIDYALKAHLFGYLFSRNNLGYLERELVVVSTLSALGNVNSQLRSHLQITRNLGVDNAQMEKIFQELEKALGSNAARNTKNVLQGI